jgi:hypothetical protein
MTDDVRARRYRHLLTRVGTQPLRDLLDRLQVLALIQPEAVRELEAFIDRDIEAAAKRGARDGGNI